MKVQCLDNTRKVYLYVSNTYIKVSLLMISWRGGNIQWINRKILQNAQRESLLKYSLNERNHKTTMLKPEKDSEYF